MDNKAFLRGVNEKQEKVWKELYRYYYAPLCSYAEKMIGESDAAEDVVQECLIRMWHAEVNFPELKALTAWLYKSVYHACVSILREKKSRCRLRDKQVEWVDNEEQAKEMALREEAISRFYEVLYRMPHQQRDILIHTLKGLKVQEIAEVMQISENSVKTQKKRAYLFVREHFDATSLQILFTFFFRS